MMDKKLDKCIKELHSDILALSPEEFAKREGSNKSTLAVTYRHLGDIEKSREMFRYLTKGKVCESKFPKDATEKDKTDTIRRVEWGGIEVKWGVHLDLAGEHEAARKQFEWAAENCLLDDEGYRLASINIDFLALANLWRGYSLLVLGDYNEAYRLLNTVVSLFNKFKSGGGDMQFKKIEYFLPKLLVPLCEYKLNPTDENRKKSIAGIDAFIGSFRNEIEKFDAYVYCLHLKELHPDAYGKSMPVSIGRASDKSLPKVVKPSKQSVTPEEYIGSGTVVVLDRDNDYEQIFGGVEDFERYWDNIKAIGGYPALDRLFELYQMDEEVEPMPVLEDCVRLLETPGLDSFMREKSERILDVAREADEKGSTILLFYEEDIPYSELKG